MSIAALITADQRIILRDARFSPDEVVTAALAYQEAKDAADADWDQRRHTHHDRVTTPAEEQAAYDLQTVCAPTLAWHEAPALIRQVQDQATHLTRARAAHDQEAGL